MSVLSPSDNAVVTTDPTRVTIDIDAPNGVVRTSVQHDGIQVIETSGDWPVDFIRFNEFAGNGFHSKSYLAYDRAGIGFTEALPFYINQGPGTNQGAGGKRGIGPDAE